MPTLPSSGDPQRVEARLAAFRLILGVQVADTGTAVADALAAAETRGWPEVVRVLLYVDVVRSKVAGEPSVVDRIEALLERAGRDGDQAMLVTALAARAENHYESDSEKVREASDADLSRATALLDQAAGGALELVTAYTACGIAWGQRELWEIEEEMYARAAGLAADCEEPGRSLVITYNRLETLVLLACGMRELDLDDDLRELYPRALDAAQQARAESTPGTWLTDVRILTHALLALVGEPSTDSTAELDDALASSSHPAREAGRQRGYLRLVDALRAVEVADWAECARAADVVLEVFDEEHSPLISLTLRLAARSEAERATVAATKMLSYADYCARRRWETRMRILQSARASLLTEQLRSERDMNAVVAYVDDLTGLANRRAYARHLDQQRGDGDRRSSAVLVVDVDSFKAVNDTYGHLAGDEVLRRIAQVVAAEMRGHDLVARVGGDEFVAWADGMDLDGARTRATSILTGLAELPWAEVAPGLEVSVSIGVASATGGDPESLVEAADLALYQAKARGGACLACAPPPLAAVG